MRPIPQMVLRSPCFNPLKPDFRYSLTTQALVRLPDGDRGRTISARVPGIATIDQCLECGRVNDAARRFSTAPLSDVLLDPELRKPK